MFETSIMNIPADQRQDAFIGGVIE